MTADTFTYRSTITTGSGVARHRAEVQGSYAKTACGRTVGAFVATGFDADCKRCLARALPPIATPEPAPKETTVSDPSTVTASRDAILAYATLTEKGRKFMALVGHRRFDFFDDGIVEFSGNWGSNMNWQAADMLGISKLSAAGTLAGLPMNADTGALWSVNEQSTAKVGAPKAKDTWWQLTALGAEVALLAADMDRSLGR